MYHLSDRHDVLQTLGVKQWYSRYSLPNAAEASASLLSELIADKSTLIDDVPDLADVSLISSSAVSPTQALSKSLLQDDLETESPKVLVEPDISVQAAETLVAQPELNISAKRFGKLCILYERFSSHDHKLEDAFLGAVIKSLDRSKFSSASAEFTALVWPVFKSSVFIHTQAAHFKSLFRRWLKSQSLAECEYVIYFGLNFENLESYFLNFKSEQGFDGIFVPIHSSLAEIMGSPIKKKNVWEVLSKVGGVNG